jgi:hypothetical protein
MTTKARLREERGEKGKEGRIPGTVPPSLGSCLVQLSPEALTNPAMGERPGKGGRAREGERERERKRKRKRCQLNGQQLRDMC